VQVKFALKKNLYFTKGGPIPPADLRTPPTAQPKGSALKRRSLQGPSALQPRSAPKSPGSVPRAKAAMFF
jgi:ribosomal RNA-processing protein 1